MAGVIQPLDNFPRRKSSFVEIRGGKCSVCVLENARAYRVKQREINKAGGDRSDRSRLSIATKMKEEAELHKLMNKVW